MEKKIPTLEEIREFVHSNGAGKLYEYSAPKPLQVMMGLSTMKSTEFTIKDFKKIMPECDIEKAYPSISLASLVKQGLLLRVGSERSEDTKKFGGVSELAVYKWDENTALPARVRAFIKDWNEAHGEEAPEQECVKMLAQMIEQEEAKAEPVPQSKSQEQVKMDIGTDLTLKQACELTGISEQNFREYADRCSVKIVEVKKPINKEYKYLVPVEGAFAVLKMLCKEKSIEAIEKAKGESFKAYNELKEEAKRTADKCNEIIKANSDLSEKSRTDDFNTVRILKSLYENGEAVDYQEATEYLCGKHGIVEKKTKNGRYTNECIADCIVAEVKWMINECKKSYAVSRKVIEHAEGASADKDTKEVNDMLKALKKKWQGEALSDFKKRIGEVIG